MKKSLVSLIFYFVCLPLFPATFSYPSDTPVFQITFPDDWTTNIEDNILHAGPADGQIYLGVWALPDGLSLESAGEEVGKIVDDLVTETVFNDPKQIEKNGISFLTMDGSGKDKENGAPMNLNTTFFSPDNKNIFILLYFGSPDAEIKHSPSYPMLLNR